MRFSRPDSRLQLSRKERWQGLLVLIFMIAVVLYGMYLGVWLLRQEEQNDNPPQFDSGASVLPSVQNAAGV